MTPATLSMGKLVLQHGSLLQQSMGQHITPVKILHNMVKNKQALGFISSMCEKAQQSTPLDSVHHAICCREDQSWSQALWEIGKALGHLKLSHQIQCILPFSLFQGDKGNGGSKHQFL